MRASKNRQERGWISQFWSIHSELVRKTKEAHPGWIPPSIQVGWNGRFSMTMGRCTKELFRAYSIEFSAKLYPLATPKKIRENMIHELAHAFAHSLSGRMGHDAVWRRLMVLYGQEPSRCYEVSEENFGENTKLVSANAAARKRKRYKIHCPCGVSNLQCGPVQKRRIETGKTSYRCGSCRGKIDQSSKFTEVK